MYTVHSNTICPWFLSKTKPNLDLRLKKQSRYPQTAGRLNCELLGTPKRQTYTYNIYIIYIILYIYTELAPKLSATASVCISVVEHWSSNPEGDGFNSQPEGLGVAFFATGPGLGLIMYILTTLQFPKQSFDFHLLTTSVNAKYY